MKNDWHIPTQDVENKGIIIRNIILNKLDKNKISELEIKLNNSMIPFIYNNDILSIGIMEKDLKIVNEIIFNLLN